ncbi:hypothetical protein FOZ62_015005, partial [Perkinsus olseni]
TACVSRGVLMQVTNFALRTPAMMRCILNLWYTATSPTARRLRPPRLISTATFTALEYLPTTIRMPRPLEIPVWSSKPDREWMYPRSKEAGSSQSSSRQRGKISLGRR